MIPWLVLTVNVDQVFVLAVHLYHCLATIYDISCSACIGFGCKLGIERLQVYKVQF